MSEAPRAGAVHTVIAAAVRALPRGRARIARGLSRILRAPFVDVVVPTSVGVRLEIDPRDVFQLEIWLGAYQPHVAFFLLTCVRPGDTVLCAGLHVGYVASLARALAGPRGHVLSAEPDASARRTAHRNLQLAPHDAVAPIEILEGGLSDAPGTIRLFESATLGHSSFAAPHQPRSEAAVPVARGDDWLRTHGVDHLDVMVLDVEGWELHALRGLTETIARSPHLVALVEVSDWALEAAGSTRRALIEYWRERGYTVRWASRYGRKHSMGVWGDIAGATGAAGAADVLCYRPHS